MARHGLNPDKFNKHDGMTDIMIDIETDGLDARKNSMRQLAAKKFNFKTGQIGKDIFIANIKPLVGRVEDPNTMEWWAKQDSTIREGVFENPLDTAMVINAFADWCYPQNTLHFWGKPTHFDFVWIQSYFEELKIPMPFHYRMAKDMNSVITGLYHPKDRPPDEEVPYEDIGGAHNALSDVINQISELLAHEKYARTYKK